MSEDCFHLKGNVLTSIVIELNHYDPKAFFQLLQEKIARAPSFFLKSPVIMDVRTILPSMDADKLNEMAEVCAESGLQPIGFKGIADKSKFASINLALLTDDLTRENQPRKNTPDISEKLAITEKQISEPAAELKSVSVQQPRPTQYIDTPVRSGQQVYAADANLVVLSNINKGAEILADGDIHVYGALRGRALAGVKGEVGARIFCQQLEAELISIAGVFKLSDNVDSLHQGQAVQVRLQDEDLIVKTL